MLSDKSLGDWREKLHCHVPTASINCESKINSRLAIVFHRSDLVKHVASSGRVHLCCLVLGDILASIHPEIAEDKSGGGKDTGHNKRRKKRMTWVTLSVLFFSSCKTLLGLQNFANFCKILSCFFQTFAHYFNVFLC